MAVITGMYRHGSNIMMDVLEKAVSSSFQYGSGVHVCGNRSGPEDVWADSILILDIALIATQI